MAEPKREEKVIPIDGAGQGPEGDDPPDPSLTGEAALAAELDKLKAEKEELLQTMIRRQADFENFRKRTERDRYEEGRRGVERLIVDLTRDRRHVFQSAGLYEALPWKVER
jgi:molecular chaperone GrpE (heat shock protein)